MTSICRKKPNRSAPRFFSPCDVARIARNCVDDRNLRPEEVLACVAKGLGFTHVSLSNSQNVMESNVSIGKNQISLLKSGLNFILGVVKRRFPAIAKTIAGLIELLDNLDRILDRILGPESEPVDDVIKPGTCNCKQGEVEKWQQARSRRDGR